LSALEDLAEIALNSAEDRFTRALARSVLAQDVLLLHLWKSYTKYIPLVHELLLALDK